MRVAAGLVLALAVSESAFAQAPYVGASFIGDVLRVSGSTDGDLTGNGETFGGALRAGVPLGTQWGVELEFARTGELEATPDVRILADVQGVVGSGSFGYFPEPAIFPTPEISTKRQLSTVSTLLWWNHELNDRVSLAYLGGVSFTRAELAFRVSYDDFPIPVFPGGVPLPLPRPRPVIESRSVVYDADVAVGFEGRIGMTEHLRLVPGIRLQTAAGGWAIRPGVGLQWMF